MRKEGVQYNLAVFKLGRIREAIGVREESLTGLHKNRPVGETRSERVSSD